ncbi:hypothetical protein [Methylobacterium sp. J-092]|uniref:hypothetical protein n=1 Tax=Methylobacterium sp. J-092 TaxID=2836667 RepID=UPI001FBBBA1E|nr:hypothetical protein [Methylobacterium sp. J-092]MCJ2009772.1 hypothetical protein [Methylobacterium sp. J-092]
MQPGTYPRNKHFDAEASRRAAERIVRENQAAAERFALGQPLKTADAAIVELQAALTTSLREVAR